MAISFQYWREDGGVFLFLFILMSVFSCVRVCVFKGLKLNIIAYQRKIVNVKCYQTDVFHLRSILAFGLFASNRPVESPISKEFCFLFLRGEPEWDRSGEDSSGEQRTDWTWEAAFKRLWKNRSGCIDSSTSHSECEEPSTPGSVE